MICFQLLGRAAQRRKCRTIEIYGGSRYILQRERKRRRGGIRMRDKREMKRKKRKSPGREESPRETIGLDREGEIEQRRECLINGLFIKLSL